MSRGIRKVPLTPIERTFDMDRWVRRHVTIVEGSAPEYVAFCPDCGRPKLAINVDIKAFQCLYAGCRFAGWSPAWLIAKVRGIPLGRAEAELTAYALGVASGPLPDLGGTPQGRLAELPAAPFPPLHHLGPAQLSYLESRSVPREHIGYFGLTQAGTLGRAGFKADRLLPGRLVIPAYSDGRAVYWSARACRGEQPKTVNLPSPCRTYAHPPDCTCTQQEWGLPLVPFAASAREIVVGAHLISPGSRVIVVEGDMDAVTCGPGFVATLGAHMSPDQAAMIARTGAKEAIVLFDGDAGGEKAKMQAAYEISKYMGVRVATCPWGEDPGSLGRVRAIEIAEQAAPLGALPALRPGSRTRQGSKSKDLGGQLKSLRKVER